jgi:hypothetical protein
MHAHKFFVIGGIVASIILLAFGVTSMVVGYNGRQEVRDTLAEENIVGPEDSTIPGQLVDTGSEARAQADIMRKHMLESSQGLTYAEMGRFATPDGDPKGTNNSDLAANDVNGKPVANAVRNQWVTETSLATALNTAYFAEQVGVFAIVMGVALMLTGGGFAVLTVGTLWYATRRPETELAATVAAQQARHEGSPGLT